MTKLEKKKTNGKFIKNKCNKTANKFLMIMSMEARRKFLSLNKTVNIKINRIQKKIKNKK